MQVVILAGGLGTRLRPITERIPKPLVPVNNRPYLEYQIEYLRRSGFTDILLVTGYLGEKIEAHFGNGTTFGVRLTYAQEDVIRGTGGALKYAEDHLADEFLVVYGDSFLPISYSGLIEAFLNSRKKGMIVAYDNRKSTDVKNNVALDDHFLVIRYDKTVSDKRLRYVESGVLVLKKSIIGLIPAEKVVSLEIDIFPQLIVEKQLAAFVTKERFYDIGTPLRLQEAGEYFKVWQ